jgi:hypothetical protein
MSVVMFCTLDLVLEPEIRHPAGLQLGIGLERGMGVNGTRVGVEQTVRPVTRACAEDVIHAHVERHPRIEERGAQLRQGLGEVAQVDLDPRLECAVEGQKRGRRIESRKSAAQPERECPAG